ncbi:hypothetical protein AGR9A_Lc40114 [Agrobacterium salinitolerans str. Hayward 0363]|nr:hypothetical protein AGR9A_Lc40114 [Agrobacterium salinitolerans str. Hayward 0363]
MIQRRAHMHVRNAVKIDRANTIPMKATEQWNVLLLNVSVELDAPHAVCGADRQADQLGAELAYPSIITVDSEPRAPPDSGGGLMDADRAHDFGRFCRHRRNRCKRDRHIIDLVTVVQFENPLFVNKHRVTKPRDALELPVFGRGTNNEFRAYKGRMAHAAHAGTLNFS